jgi:hypothetical protein
MDWKEIEEEFKEKFQSAFSYVVFLWLKERIESDISVSNRISPLTEEERNEFYTTNITADIKANYGR